MSKLAELKDYSTTYIRSVSSLRSLQLKRTCLENKAVGLKGVNFEPHYGSSGNDNTMFSVECYQKVENLNNEIAKYQAYIDYFEKCLTSTKYIVNLPYLLMFVLERKTREEILQHTLYDSVKVLDNAFHDMADNILTQERINNLNQLKAKLSY